MSINDISEMVDSCLSSINNICELPLDRIETYGLDDPSYFSVPDHALVTWIQLFAQNMVAFLNSLLYYTFDRWDHQDLVSLLDDIEDALKYTEANLETDCSSAERWSLQTKRCRIQKICKFICRISEDVGDANDDLAKAHHRPMKRASVFDKFVDSVQAYLQSLPLELQAYFYPGGGLNIIQYNKDPDIRESAAYQIWPFSKVNQSVAVLVRNLEILKHLIDGFSSCRFDDENLLHVRARAGALVYNILHSSWVSIKDRDGNSFTKSLFCTLPDLSDKISNQNLEVNEIYLGVLEGYVDLLKSVKPSSGSIGSLMVDEDMTHSFLSFIFSAKNSADIMHQVLKFPLIDVADTPEDCRNDLIELFLKRVIVAVKKALSLDQSIWDDEIPNGQVMPANSGISKLWQKIKLIRAEIFLQALNNHKADLMISINDKISAAAAVCKAMRLLANFFSEPDFYMQSSEKLILALIEDAIREATSIYKSNEKESIEQDILESSEALLMLFKAEATLMVLMPSLEFLARYRIESLHKVLILLRALISHPMYVNLEDGDFSTSLGALASGAASFVCSFGEQRIEEDTNRKMDLLLPCLSRMIDEITQLYQPSSWSLFSNSPKSGGIGFLGRLLGELRELLTSKPDVIAFMKDQARESMEELEFVLSLPKDDVNQLIDNTDLGRRFICLVYYAEYIIDLSVTGGLPLWYHQLGVLNLLLETRLIKAQALEFFEKKKPDYATGNVELVLRDMTVEATTSSKMYETIEEVDQDQDKVQLSLKDEEVMIGEDSIWILSQ